MKIAHVVTLVSPDGAFGGPVRVATNLARAQLELGHDVTLLGAFRGWEHAPAEVEGVAAALFPIRVLSSRLGFSGMHSPGLRDFAARELGGFDVVHVHLARDLITLPIAMIARRRGIPYVLQTHGMVDRSEKRLARILDAVATKRVLRSARAIFYLTADERAELAALLGGEARSSLTFLPNGVPVPSPVRPRRAAAEVLYLARLHARKRPAAFVEAAIELAPEFPNVRFAIVGPDEGELLPIEERVERAGAIGERISIEGPLPPAATLDRMARADVYVLPSVNEPFPMSVLEAMSLGLPCVVTDTCGLVSAVEDPASLVVVDDSASALIASIRSLLADDSARVDAGQRARAEILANFTLRPIAERALVQYAAEGQR